MAALLASKHHSGTRGQGRQEASLERKEGNARSIAACLPKGEKSHYHVALETRKKTKNTISKLSEIRDERGQGEGA